MQKKDNENKNFIVEILTVAVGILIGNAIYALFFIR